MFVRDSRENWLLGNPNRRCQLAVTLHPWVKTRRSYERRDRIGRFVGSATVRFLPSRFNRSFRLLINFETVMANFLLSR